MLQVFNFDETTAIRTDLHEGDVWFVAKDMADILEYASQDKAYVHCKRASNLALLNKNNNLAPATKWIPESDLYRLIMKSTKAEAEKFQDWVVEDVLPTIRKTGGYAIVKPAQDPVKLEMDLLFAKTITESLRLPDSGKLLVFSKIERAHNLTPILPAYAVDAPTGDTSGSSKPTKAASDLLKDNGKPMSAIKFNVLAIDAGLLEIITRSSTSKGTKEFKSITEMGLKYGKNITNPKDPRETQPHWYVETFGEVLELLK